MLVVVGSFVVDGGAAAHEDGLPRDPTWTAQSRHGADHGPQRLCVRQAGRAKNIVAVGASPLPRYPRGFPQQPVFRRTRVIATAAFSAVDNGWTRGNRVRAQLLRRRTGVIAATAF